MNFAEFTLRRLPHPECSSAELHLLRDNALAQAPELVEDSIRCIGANQSAELAHQLNEFAELAALPWSWTRFVQCNAVALKQDDEQPHGVAFGQGRVDLSLGDYPEGRVFQIHLHAPVPYGWGLCRDDFALQTVMNQAIQRYMAVAQELVARANEEFGPGLPVCAFEGDWGESLQSWKRLLAKRFVEELVRANADQAGWRHRSSANSEFAPLEPELAMAA